MIRKLLIVLCLSCSTLLAADLPQPGASVLGRWIGGKWVGDGKMVATNYSQAMTVSGVTNCSWSPDHVFVVCDQAVTVNSRQDRELSIYAFDPDMGVYHMFGMSPSGERPRVTEVDISVDHNRWEYLNKTEISGKAVEFRTVNVFRDDDHVDWWSEYSTDNGAHWVRTGEGKESRQK